MILQLLAAQQFHFGIPLPRPCHEQHIAGIGTSSPLYVAGKENMRSAGGSSYAISKGTFHTIILHLPQKFACPLASLFFQHYQSLGEPRSRGSHRGLSRCHVKGCERSSGSERRRRRRWGWAWGQVIVLPKNWMVDYEHMEHSMDSLYMKNKTHRCLAPQILTRALVGMWVYMKLMMYLYAMLDILGSSEFMSRNPPFTNHCFVDFPRSF